MVHNGEKSKMWRKEKSEKQKHSEEKWKAKSKSTVEKSEKQKHSDSSSGSSHEAAASYTSGRALFAESINVQEECTSRHQQRHLHQLLLWWDLHQQHQHKHQHKHQHQHQQRHLHQLTLMRRATILFQDLLVWNTAYLMCCSIDAIATCQLPLVWIEE